MTDRLITKVTIYRSLGEWCYAAWIGAEFDHADVLGVPDDASEGAVRTEIAAMFAGDVAVERVSDVEAA